MSQSRSLHQASIRHQTYAQYLFIYALVGHAIFMLPYIYSGNAFVMFNNALCFVVDIVALRLNRKGKTHLAMAIFMLAITYHTTSSILVFGLYTGLSYYYLTIILITVFSPFRWIQKIAGLLVFGALTLIMIHYSLTHEPILRLSQQATVLWHLGHGLANVCAVAYSAYFYLHTNETMETLVDVIQDSSSRNYSNQQEGYRFMEKEMDRSFREGIGFGAILIQFPQRLSMRQWMGCREMIRDQLRVYDEVERFAADQVLVVCTIKKEEDLQAMTTRIFDVMKISCASGEQMRFASIFATIGENYESSVLIEKLLTLLEESKQSGESIVFRHI